jgi:hypothetical protein
MLPSSFLVAYTLLALVIFVPAIIHADAPAAADAFFLTRPISRKTLLASKMTLILSLTVFLPALLETLNYWLILALPWSAAPRAFSVLLLFYGSIVLPGAFIASCTKKTSDYVVVLCAAALVCVAISFVHAPYRQWPLRAFYLAPSFELAWQIQSTQVLQLISSWAIACLISLLALYHCYVSRSLKAAASLVAGGILLLLLLGLPEIFAVNQGLKNTLEPQFSSVHLLEAFVTIRSKEVPTSLKGEKEKRREMSFRLLTTSPDPAVFPVLLRFKNVKITDDDGRSIDVPAENRGTIPCIEPSSMARLLAQITGGNVKVLNSTTCDLGTLYPLPKEAKINHNQLPAFSGEAYGIEYRLKLETELAADAAPNSQSFWKRRPLISLNAYSYRHPGWSQYYLTEHLFAPLVYNTGSTPLDGASALYAHNYATLLYYVLYSPKNGEALILSAPRSTGPETGAISHYDRNTLPLMYYGLQQEQDKHLERWGDDIVPMRFSSHIIKSFIAPVSSTLVPIFTLVTSASETSSVE